MKTFLKVLKWTGIVLVVVVGGLFVFVQLNWNQKVDAPFPDIKASTDSAVIARGKYLVEGPAHCIGCHVPNDKHKQVYTGEIFPLSGGYEVTYPGFGTFRAPNLTPDMETGIGKRTDAELARSIRYNVRHDGTPMIQFMFFQGLSDDDLTAIISFLRSQPAVKHEVKPHDIGILTKVFMAFGVMKGEGPKSTPPKHTDIDTTIAYGQYVADYVAQCRNCHIQYDMNTGKQISADYAGNGLWPADDKSEGYSFVSPNLTPHSATGIMAHWSEDVFISRFKAGPVHKTSPMPWAMMARMNDVELKAVYRFLQSLEPVENKIEKTVYFPGEKHPEQ